MRTNVKAKTPSLAMEFCYVHSNRRDLVYVLLNVSCAKQVSKVKLITSIPNLQKRNRAICEINLKIFLQRIKSDRDFFLFKRFLLIAFNRKCQ